MRKIDTIILHCSDSRKGNAIMIDGWHRNRDWDCIGYHYVICNGSEPIRKSDGIIEAGRLLDIPGAHVYGHNQTSIGICLIGSPGTPFTDKQLLSVRELCLNLISKFSIAPNRLLGHYELDDKKTCPGVDMSLMRDWILKQSYKSYEKLTNVSE